VARVRVVSIATRCGLDGPGSNPRVSEIVRILPDRSWGPPSLLYNWNRVSFPEVKRPGRGLNHPRPSRAEVRERVYLYHYSRSWPSSPVGGWTLPFIYLISTSNKNLLQNCRLITLLFHMVPSTTEAFRTAWDGPFYSLLISVHAFIVFHRVQQLFRITITFKSVAINILLQR
jgi:hypothetical protein